MAHFEPVYVLIGLGGAILAAMAFISLQEFEQTQFAEKYLCSTSI